MNDDLTTPDDYTAEDGWNADRGLEQCPHCDRQLSGESGHHGEVYDSTGREYGHLTNTDPVDGPFFCPDCWPELEANQRAVENRSLGEFA